MMLFIENLVIFVVCDVLSQFLFYFFMWYDTLFSLFLFFLSLSYVLINCLSLRRINVRIRKNRKFGEGAISLGIVVVIRSVHFTINVLFRK